MSKTVSTCICETNLIQNQPQENVFFLTLSRKIEDFPNEFLRTARSTSPIQICSIFSCIGPDNLGAMINLELNNELEKIVAQYSNQPVLDFEAFSNQVVNVLNLKVCNFAVQKGTQLKVSMTMLVVEGDILRVIHIGNTKAVLVRDNRIMLLTEEQTVAHRYVQMGALTPEQEKTHPENMNLTQYLGKLPQDGPVVPDKKIHLKLKDNDEIALMGLGISRQMPAQMRNVILVKPNNTEAKAKEIINSAMNYGIKSGLTFIVMKVESTFLLPGDAVLNGAFAGEAVATTPEKAEPSYTPFDEPAKSDDSTKAFVPDEDDDDYDDDYDDDDYDDDFEYEKASKPKDNKMIGIIITIIVFLIFTVVGFGLTYLVFNFKDIVGKKASTTTTTTNAENTVMYVINDNTPLYIDADLTSTVVGSLKRGETVTIVQVNDMFANVTTLDKKCGFILAAQITNEDPTIQDAIDAATAEPTPIPIETSAAPTTTMTEYVIPTDPVYHYTTRATTRATTAATTESSEVTETSESSQATEASSESTAAPTTAATTPAPTTAPTTAAPTTAAPTTQAPAVEDGE